MAAAGLRPALIVTSPPYNAGVDYGPGICDDLPWDQYWEWAREWVRTAQNMLCDGGRLCLVVSSHIGRSPAMPLASRYEVLCQDVGLLCRGSITWDKGAARKNSTAWGSFCSPSNPSLRDHGEVVLVFSKGRFDLPNPRGEKADVPKSVFIHGTSNFWRLNPERDRSHPAPFPEELAARLLLLYTWPGDLVVDPFAGSGTTGVVAIRHGRRFVGVEINPEYVAMAQARIDREREKLQLPFDS